MDIFNNETIYSKLIQTNFSPTACLCTMWLFQIVCNFHALFSDFPFDVIFANRSTYFTAFRIFFRSYLSNFSQREVLKNFERPLSRTFKNYAQTIFHSFYRPSFLYPYAPEIVPIFFLPIYHSNFRGVNSAFPFWLL